jgi:hypothetical protein
VLVIVVVVGLMVLCHWVTPLCGPLRSQGGPHGRLRSNNDISDNNMMSRVLGKNLADLRERVDGVR